MCKFVEQLKNCRLDSFTTMRAIRLCLFVRGEHLRGEESLGFHHLFFQHISFLL
uniref:Uncharacterized protein n=1 Tax=Meloidogyne enterolobii TaxID=390850 RepID=A0A6V7U8C4_MELEN|nr:unnamed protein product [Meloidogyne enterolobii]